MLTYSKAFYSLKDKLQPLYDEGEATSIAHLFLEHVTGLSKLDRLARKDEALSDKQERAYNKAMPELIKGRPLQYITGSAWFMGQEFIVNEHVLIPRPETEELVQWILDEAKSYKLKILDIGSGSGCIGLSLRKKLKQSVLTCVDISGAALEILQTNIPWVLPEGERDRIKLLCMDFLDEHVRNEALQRYDIIVSNPPYIPKSEEKKMHANVTAYEPHVALFVPDNDALVFYRAIAEAGPEHLKQGGAIYCELDAAHAEETKALFEEMGYSAEIRKDMHGNLRMLKASLIG